MGEQTIRRFIRRYTVQPNGCWLWNKPHRTKGYGQMSVEGQNEWAQRISLRIFDRDPLPQEDAHHKCDSKACVNPQHLAWELHDEHSLLHLHNDKCYARKCSKCKARDCHVWRVDQKYHSHCVGCGHNRSWPAKVN